MSEFTRSEVWGYVEGWTASSTAKDSHSRMLLIKRQKQCIGAIVAARETVHPHMIAKLRGLQDFDAWIRDMGKKDNDAISTCLTTGDYILPPEEPANPAHDVV